MVQLKIYMHHKSDNEMLEFYRNNTYVFKRTKMLFLQLIIVYFVLFILVRWFDYNLIITVLVATIGLGISYYIDLRKSVIKIRVLPDIVEVFSRKSKYTFSSVTIIINDVGVTIKDNDSDRFLWLIIDEWKDFEILIESLKGFSTSTKMLEKRKGNIFSDFVEFISTVFFSLFS